ncbi:MAG: undecaprenyl-diphosphate phosphatase [Betaproteobacteria bacterium]|nr:MAG: undecaprenyl-diphosphate phosphatase [Betaproteobacteria bacterium]
MEFALLAKAFVLGAVEGLTEFLPISSTGHLILVGELLGFADEKAKVFEIVIQTGAMFAIVWEYRRRFSHVLAGIATDRAAQRFALNLLVAFTPAALLGLALGKLIKTHLFHAVPVALAFIVGAFIILWVERRRRAAVIQSVDEMTWKDALKVGIAQALALIPGTSRSGATIIGGMLFGLSRRAATEFSFFLAVPTLVAAGAYDFWKNRTLFDSGDVGMFAVGSAAAFASAFLCVRWLLRYIATHDFTPFAWYRIAFGVAVLVTAYAGVVNWSAG